MEKYGAQGLRFSTPMANAAVDYETQSTKDLGQLLAQLAYSSNESAMGRYMSAIGQGSSMFQGLGTSFTPSVALYSKSGEQSGTGAAVGAVGNALQTISLLSMMGLI
jgi:hypothetical protein